MQCPKCHFENPEGSTECPRCGIVFAKYHPHQEPVKPVEPPPQDPELQKELQKEQRTEFLCRVLGIPIALIVARLGVATVPVMVRILTMLVHETGHAVAAWICGYSAFPGLWFTPVSETQEPSVTVIMIAVLAGLSYWAWRTNRWYVIAFSVAVLFLHFICWHARYDRAHEIFIFFGDGGALVLGTLLMTTMYVPRDSPVYQNELRWGFLAIGAAAFVDVFHTWSGGEENIAFGVQEGTKTDPSQLVETYGWTIPGMMQSYMRLAELCLVALAIVYVSGIIQARRKWL
jgi:hypothetical protein